MRVGVIRSVILTSQLTPDPLVEPGEGFDECSLRTTGLVDHASNEGLARLVGVADLLSEVFEDLGLSAT